MFNGRFIEIQKEDLHLSRSVFYHNALFKLISNLFLLIFRSLKEVLGIWEFREFFLYNYLTENRTDIDWINRCNVSLRTLLRQKNRNNKRCHFICSWNTLSFSEINAEIKICFLDRTRKNENYFYMTKILKDCRTSGFWWYSLWKYNLYFSHMHNCVIILTETIFRTFQKFNYIKENNDSYKFIINTAETNKDIAVIWL